MQRRQFTFYRSIYDSGQMIPDPVERLGLYEAVMEFALDGKEPEGLSAWQASLFVSIRPNLEASIQKAKAGIASAKKRYGNENEKEKEKEKENEIEKEYEDECPADGGFTAFWELYPVKLGKKEAKAAWDKCVEDPQAVMNGVRMWSQSAQWRRENKRFIPRAAKFLTQGDYKVDPPGYVPTGGTGALGKAELEAIARIVGEGE